MFRIHFDSKTWILETFASLATNSVIYKAGSDTVHSSVSPYISFSESWVGFQYTLALKSPTATNDHATL